MNKNDICHERLIMKKRNSTTNIPVSNSNIFEIVKPNDYPADKTKEDGFTEDEDLTYAKFEDICSEENNYDIDMIKEEKTQNDLGIPGSELDDEQENAGSEDEENNYYSIGSDNHNDLEEDNNV